MQVISEEKINEIRNAADILNIIGEYIPLKVQGKNYFGICPFHDDHSPSMSVSKERQLFKCFVCGKGGNVFTFVKDYENISFMEAVKKVADKVGIPLQISSIKKTESKYQKEYEIVEYATKIFQNNLNSQEGVSAKKYLLGRSITDEIIADFRIGYSLNNNKYLQSVLAKKEFNMDLAENLGLVNINGLDVYDKFINRIMIPICNEYGNVVGFTGRIFNGEDEAKYINTKETPIYTKGNILFNYHNAKNYVRDEKCIILVEGNMDAIRVYASGIKNVIALMGTVITKEQIELIKKLHTPVILMLDNDNAGSEATITVGDELFNNNIDVKVVRLDTYKDPDEYIVNFGIDKFKDTIKHAKDYLEYKINYLKNTQDLNNSEQLASYLKQVLSFISNKDNLTKEIVIKKLSNEYDIDYETLKSELSFKEDKKVVVKSLNNIKSVDKYKTVVYAILYYLMIDKKYLEIFNDELGYLNNREERDLIREIENYIDKYKSINLADFISYSETKDSIKDLVLDIVNSIKDDEEDEKIFKEYIKALKGILNKDERNKLKEELKKETDINKKIELSKRLTELVKGCVKDGRN